MRSHRALLLGLFLALPACRERPTLTDNLTPGERRTVERWLLCEECIDGELDSVYALGNRAVPFLKAALEGPPPDRRENMRRQAEEMYREIADTARFPLQTFLDHYGENYVASYQSRAATALDSIDTPAARQILLDALHNDSAYRVDVRRVLGQAVGAQLSLLTGDSQHAPFDSFVRVNPQVTVRDSATGAGLNQMRVLFYVDSGRGRVFDSVEFTDTAGRAEVRWQLGPQPQDSINLLRAVAAGRAVRFHARAHPLKIRVVFVAQPRNAKVGQPITPPVRIEIQDAWGITQKQINQTVTVNVVGTSLTSTYPLVAGVAQLTGLSIPEVRTNLVLIARVPGAEYAYSVPFDIGP